MTRDSKQTSSFQESGDFVELILWQRWQDFTGCIHIASQNCCLIFNHIEREGITVDVDIFVGKVDTVVSWDVAEEV